jgi:hypothetical protein
VVHARGPDVLKLRAALEKYAVQNSVISEELLAAFKRDIQEWRKELAKAA